MRAFLLSSCLALISASALAAPFYNPANIASETGNTSGIELFGTIGCPGRELLAAPCVDDRPKTSQPEIIKDSDGDGIPDMYDQCQTTQSGRKVDKHGCDLDSDGDGVIDDLDQCPNTPSCAKVDATGCVINVNKDSDGDGVIDSLDQCPTTPAGRKVNAAGCELDGDGDGVVDALDKCPTTPAGRKVDATGCDIDSDGDGVPNSADQCPNTPAGDRINDKGCSFPRTFILKGVNFDNNADTLRPDALAILDQTVATLKEFSWVNVEVGGHTDNVGSQEHNADLSQRRAQTVMRYFADHGIAAERLSAKGYADARPVAANDSDENRERNRRVELKVVK